MSLAATDDPDSELPKDALGVGIALFAPSFIVFGLTVHEVSRRLEKGGALRFRSPAAAGAANLLLVLVGAGGLAMVLGGVVGSLGLMAILLGLVGLVGLGGIVIVVPRVKRLVGQAIKGPV